jgi:hypothetical protein
MSGPDVHDNEMDGMYDLDDAAVEALLRGHSDDSALGEALGSVRGFYAADAPALSPALASFIAAQSDVVAPLRRPEGSRPANVRSMRSRFAARTAAVAATFVAATGGLAAAGALPGPVQRAVSHAASEVGVHLPHGTNGVPGAGDESDPSNGHGGGSNNSGSNANNTPTSHPDNHGGEVSAVAHDGSQSGCEHGHAVAATASGTSDTKPCPVTGGSTIPGDETNGNGKGAGHGSDAGDAGQHKGADNGNGNGNDHTPSTPPTTATPSDQGGGDSGDHGRSGEHKPVSPNPQASQNDGGAGDDGGS